MPLTLTEKLDSRKWNTGENASVEMVYILTGTSDDLTAKTLIENSTAESYNGLAAGECLFLGASGSKRGADDWEINYRFAGSPNRANFMIGGITAASKKGWE
ncbi:MAG: hypothetical protein ACYTF6_04740 [Planctomycetota bacterium]|jgi:hypothetical protein